MSNGNGPSEKALSHTTPTQGEGWQEHNRELQVLKNKKRCQACMHLGRKEVIEGCSHLPPIWSLVKQFDADTGGIYVGPWSLCHSHAQTASSVGTTETAIPLPE